jgi:hypothetical protein
MLQPPANGKVEVKKATINLTNCKQCLALQVPGYAVLYKSNVRFSGTDNYIDDPSSKFSHLCR